MMSYTQNVNNAFSRYDGLQKRFEAFVEKAVKTFDDDLKKDCEQKFVAKLDELVSNSTAHYTTDTLMTSINLAKTDIINDIKSRQEMRDIINVDNYTNIEGVKNIPHNEYLRKVIKKNIDEGKSQQVRRQPLQRKPTAQLSSSRPTENENSQPPPPPRPTLRRT
jgi:hypothetical protein